MFMRFYVIRKTLRYIKDLVKTLNGFGMKRSVRQILSLSERVAMRRGEMLQVIEVRKSDW